MVGLITIFCAVIAIVGWIKLKNPFNPFTAMLALWAVWVPLSDMGLFGMTHPSEKIYKIILCGLIAYVVGCLMGILCRRVHFRNNPCRSATALRVNYTLLYILCFIAIAFYSLQSVQVIRLLISGHDMAYIRDLVFSKDENELRSSGLIVNLNYFVVTPTTYFMMAYLPAELFKEKKDKILIAESLIMLGLWLLTTGGRTILLFMAISVACVFLNEQGKKDKLSATWKLLITRKKTSKFKSYFAIIAGGAAVLIVIFGITFARKGADVDLLRQFYVYYGAPIRLFDYYVNIIDREHSDLYGYGLSSFYGFAYPVMFVLRQLHIIGSYPEHMLTIHNWSISKLQDSVYLGGRIHINAFVTQFFQPYLDGRFVGVAIVLAVFGFFCSVFYFKWVTYKSIRYQTAYLLMLHKIVFSMGRFWFTQPGQALSLILVFVAISYCTLNNREKNKN